MIYVVKGSITFGLPDTGDRILLHAGDRLDLWAGVSHNAVVWNEGVVRILFTVLIICSCLFAIDADIYTSTKDWDNKKT